MDINKVKGRNPELLVDYNGNPVQCFPLGGETVEVAINGTFIPESSLIRVVSKSTTEIGFIKRNDLPLADPGTPIVPGRSEMFKVIPGEIYTVLSVAIYVTIIRNSDV